MKPCNSHGHLAVLLSFPVVLSLVFLLTFGSLGPFLSKILASGISWWSCRFSAALEFLGASESVRSLTIDGICAGVGSVLAFLPVICVLFFCLSILETCGYLELAAAVMDRPLSHIGLSGHSVIPLLTGFGCSVPAIMAAGRLSSPGQRARTIFLVPFFSCSARLPIYSLLAETLFPKCSLLLITGLYLLGVLCAITAAAATHCLFPDITSHFHNTQVLSYGRFLKNLHRPSLRTALRAAWAAVRDFSKKAFTVIFLSSMVIWLLEHYDTSLHLTTNPEYSLLAALGQEAAPFLAPLGFGDWKAASALIAGLTAKEAVVSTLSILAGETELKNMLLQVFTAESTISFLIFCLFYTPCIATLAAVKKEMGGWRWPAAMMLLQCGLAWIMAFLFYHFGVLLR